MPKSEKMKRGLKIKKQQAFFKKIWSLPKSNKDSYECFAFALTADGYPVTAKELQAQHEDIKAEHQRLKWLKKSERVTQWFRKKESRKVVMNEVIILTFSAGVTFLIVALLLLGLVSKQPFFIAVSCLSLIYVIFYGIFSLVSPILMEHLSKKKGATIQQAVKWMKQGKKVVMLDMATRDPWNIEEDQLTLEEAAESKWGIYTGIACDYHQHFHSIGDKDIKTKD